MNDRLRTLVALSDPHERLNVEVRDMYNAYLTCMALTFTINRFRTEFLTAFPDRTHAQATDAYWSYRESAKNIRRSAGVA